MSSSLSLPEDDYKKLLAFIDSIIEVVVDESAPPEKKADADKKIAWAIEEGKKSLKEGNRNNPYIYFPQVYVSRGIQIYEFKREDLKRQIQDHSHQIVQLKSELGNVESRIEYWKGLFPKKQSNHSQKLDDF